MKEAAPKKAHEVAAAVMREAAAAKVAQLLAAAVERKVAANKELGEKKAQLIVATTKKDVFIIFHFYSTPHITSPSC